MAGRCLAGLLWSVALFSTACASSAPPFVADAGATVMEWRDTFVIQRAVLPGALAEAASQDRQLRVLHVVPDRVQVREGDTLAPRSEFRVSGIDAWGLYVPDVTPLYGPFATGGVIRPLPDGRWLAERVGQGAVRVRAMRIMQPPDRDTALVRTVCVDVVP